MGKRITPAINRPPVEIDHANAIIIIDSDDEAELKPKSKIPSSIVDVDAIRIDLTEDGRRSSYIPERKPSTPILPTLKRSLSSPTNSRNVKSTPSSSSPIRQLSKSPSLNNITKSSTNLPKRPSASPKSPNTTTVRKAVSTKETPLSPSTQGKSSLKVPEKWNSPSSLESRTSQALLVKMVSSASPRKLSVPRSSLLKNSATSPKRTSSILRASSNSVRKPPLSPSISASLKRPIESPERPTFSPQRSTSVGYQRFPSVCSSPGEERRTSIEPRSSQISGRSSSPERNPSQNFEAFASSSAQQQSPERNPSQMFQAFGSPPRPTRTVDARRAKSSFSPYSSKPVEKKPTAKFYELDDDESEDDLGSFISVIDSSRRRAVVNNTPRNVLSQCPLCYLMFPKNDLADHASDCTGEGEGGEEPRVGQKRGIRKNTIAAAVEMDENERKRLNKGKIDMGPTNYYADSESILATDGTGLNAEVTGMSWESAGQTRFS